MSQIVSRDEPTGFASGWLAVRIGARIACWEKRDDHGLGIPLINIKRKASDAGWVSRPRT